MDETPATDAAAETDLRFEPLLEYLRTSRGFDFTGYKRPSIQRRIEKRMQEVGIADPATYTDYLEVHPEEFTELFNTILINVTGFFRNPLAWEGLKEKVIPAILAGKPDHEPIRVWSAACASGEEAYSAAILFAEVLGVEGFARRVKLYATDVDEHALAQARQAAYTAKDLESVAAELRPRYFEAVAGRHVFRADLRRAVIFGRHNLVTDAAISKLDLLICRNALMYFNAELQKRIIIRFHFGLNHPGYLFLGKAEMLVAHTGLFTPVDLRDRIFEKVPRPNLRDRLMALTRGGGGDGEAGSLGEAGFTSPKVRDLAFDTQPDAQLVVNRQGTLLMANALARALFNIIPRDLGRPLQDAEVSYRPVELRSLLERAYAENGPIAATQVERRIGDTPPQFFDVKIVPLRDGAGRHLGASVTFHEVTRYRKLQETLQQSNQELETASEELHSANEELETTNEELQSTVEELETTNEELQSANEEMETMNEELQSANAELGAINTELRNRTQELDSANSFLEAVLTSLRAAVAVVDREMKVLAWNGRSYDLWGLRLDEVRGQPFFELDFGLPLDEVRAPVERCLEGKPDGDGVFVEAVNRRGKPFRCRVTCSPLVDGQPHPVGVILLMEEWTA